jgi:Fic family protein
MYSLMHRAHRACLSWDEFLELDLPGEMTPLETWDLLQRVGRSMGIDLPIPDLEGNQYWYLRTHEIADAVAWLQCVCRSDSQLHRALTTRQNRPVLVASRAEETIAAALLDGLDISYEEGHSLLSAKRVPRTGSERLVLNTLNAMDSVSSLIDEPFSPALLERLRQMVLDSVEPGSYPTRTPRMGLIRVTYSDDRVHAAAEQQLRYICDYANNLTGDPYDPPACRALLLPDLFRVYRPLPDMNAQVGRLAFRLYTLKAGLPVLGMIALSRIKLAWEEGTLATPTVGPPPAQYFHGREHAHMDLTDYFTIVLKMALAGLNDITVQLRRLAERDDELKALLRRDSRLNHRQRAVLSHALATPDAEFRIAHHQTAHGVVYATARADLLELVEEGYLEQQERGRAFVFVPLPDLRHIIEERQVAAERHAGPADTAIT